RTASRWMPLRKRFSSGQAPSDCFEDIPKEFYQDLRSACRRMADRGVPLERLLTTAYDAPGDLETLVRQASFQEHASLLLNVVRTHRFLSLERLLVAWLSAVGDPIRDLRQLDLCSNGHDSSFDANVRTMLNRLGSLIAHN